MRLTCCFVVGCAEKSAQTMVQLGVEKINLLTVSNSGSAGHFSCSHTVFGAYNNKVIKGAAAVGRCHVLTGYVGLMRERDRDSVHLLTRAANGGRILSGCRTKGVQNEASSSDSGSVRGRYDAAVVSEV